MRLLRDASSAASIGIDSMAAGSDKVHAKPFFGNDFPYPERRVLITIITGAGSRINVKY